MNIGLAVFIAVIVLNIGGLSLDGILYLLGWPTMTSLVRDGEWGLGVSIMALQVAGGLGLAWHFWGSSR